MINWKFQYLGQLPFAAERACVISLQATCSGIVKKYCAEGDPSEEA